jgi:hypothetical protein
MCVTVIKTATEGIWEIKTATEGIWEKHQARI